MPQELNTHLDIKEFSERLAQLNQTLSEHIIQEKVGTQSKNEQVISENQRMCLLSPQHQDSVTSVSVAFIVGNFSVSLPCSLNLMTFYFLITRRSMTLSHRVQRSWNCTTRVEFCREARQMNTATQMKPDFTCLQVF